MRQMKFLVESNEDSICPTCGAPLTARDHRKRVRKKERGEKSWVMIRRLVCTNKDCNHLHNELPDFLIPYKHYESQLIEDVLEEYMQAHMAYSGCKNEVFTSGAEDEIYKVSLGIPRMINRISTSH